MERLDVVMLPVTSRIDAERLGDSVVGEWMGVGLKAPSKIKGVVQTIERRTIRKKLGVLSQRDFAVVQENIKRIFGFGPT